MTGVQTCALPIWQVTPFTIGHDVIENEAVYVTVDTGNPSAGNSDVKVKVWYKIVTL